MFCRTKILFFADCYYICYYMFVYISETFVFSDGVCGGW